LLQNKCGRISHRELREILMTLMKMENVSDFEADDLVNEIFSDLDLSQVQSAEFQLQSLLPLPLVLF
jgi:hypothetical protein